MKVALTYILTFALGIGTSFWFMKDDAPVLAPASTKPHVGHTTRNLPKKARPWPNLFTRLGLKSGDILRAVDGQKDSAMLARLARAYEQGNVCVQYTTQNDDVERETCYRTIDAKTAEKTQPKNRPTLASPTVDMEEILRTTDTEKIREGYVPYIENGEFRGFIKPSESNALPSEIQFGDTLTIEDE